MRVKCSVSATCGRDDALAGRAAGVGAGHSDELEGATLFVRLIERRGVYLRNSFETTLQRSAQSGYVSIYKQQRHSSFF